MSGASPLRSPSKENLDAFRRAIVLAKLWRTKCMCGRIYVQKKKANEVQSIVKKGNEKRKSEEQKLECERWSERPEGKIKRARGEISVFSLHTPEHCPSHLPLSGPFDLKLSLMYFYRPKWLMKSQHEHIHTHTEHIEIQPCRFRTNLL